MVDQAYSVERDQELINLLEEGLQALSIEVSEYQLGQLMGYISLIVRWNKTYNLTAIRDPKDMIVQHLFDALGAIQSVRSSIESIRQATGRIPICLDIGSGVGIPGVPFAILMPEIHWVLVDSNGKKARFLREVKRLLNLDKMQVEAVRVHELQLEGPFVITARALASCQQILEWVEPFIISQSQVLLLKSHQGREEAVSFESDQYSHRIVPLEIPMLQAERMILAFERL